MSDIRNICWYGCLHTDENTCERKEQCKRFKINEEENIDVSNTTLYKYACTKENGYKMFIKP